MEEQASQKPMAVKVIGIIVILVAALMIVGGVLLSFVYYIVEGFYPGDGGVVETAVDEKWIDLLSDWVYNYYHVILSIQIFFAVSLFVAGFVFLISRAKARKVLQVLGWVSYSFIFFFTFLWFSESLDRVLEKNTSISAFLLSQWAIVFLLINTLLVIGLIVANKVLRSVEEKSAMVQ